MMKWSLIKLLAFCGAGVSLADTIQMANPSEPRIVNIYNFVRNSDYRVPNSEAVLYEATRQEIQLIKQANLPATWALQYDALINPNYQKLFKEQLETNDEIAAWWEIPRPLAEKAGLKWRGQHEWDSTANVGFSPGYTPEERCKLVDIYMTDFKAIFGYYPRTVGSWFIDEVTLEYMAKKYSILTSCNCKDQIGTDGYTLWGGYWNQAYYPSGLNAYMPAQTKAGQIDVPIFRMLGSDPIYQGTTPGMWTLEPVYLDDWKHENRKTVWYDSRFYRINFLWYDSIFFIRDRRRFDEKVVSPTHDTILATTSLAYGTLPVMDGALWSDTEKAGIWPVLLSPEGKNSSMTPDGSPVVTELNSTDLSISQPLRGGGTFSIICRETNVAFTGVDGKGQPLHLACEMVGGVQQKSAVQAVTSNNIAYRYTGVNYQLQPAPDAGSCQQLSNGRIRLSPNNSGKLVLILATTDSTR